MRAIVATNVMATTLSCGVVVPLEGELDSYLRSNIRIIRKFSVYEAGRSTLCRGVFRAVVVGHALQTLANAGKRPS